MKSASITVKYVGGRDSPSEARVSVLFAKSIVMQLENGAERALKTLILPAFTNDRRIPTYLCPRGGTFHSWPRGVPKKAIQMPRADRSHKPPTLTESLAFPAMLPRSLCSSPWVVPLAQLEQTSRATPRDGARHFRGADFSSHTIGSMGSRGIFAADNASPADLLTSGNDEPDRCAVPWTVASEAFRTPIKTSNPFNEMLNPADGMPRGKAHERTFE